MADFFIWFTFPFVMGALSILVVQDARRWFHGHKATMLHDLMHKLDLEVTRDNANVMIELADRFNYNLDAMEKFCLRQNPRDNDTRFIEIIRDDPDRALRIAKHMTVVHGK